MNRDQALELLHEHVIKSEALIKHMLSVEAAMGHYAKASAHQSPGKQCPT